MTVMVAEGVDARTRICSETIAALVDAHTDVAGALVSTVDGFAVASTLREPVSAARLAAMTSSLVALAEAISREGQAGNCRDLVIDGTDGRVLLMDVPDGAQTLLLTVLCESTATLGQVLWAARHCRADMSERLRLR